MQPKGKGPERRSGHSMVTVENCLYIFGGWNNTTQFQDLFVLDCTLETPTWMGVDEALSMPRWDHASCSVMAIPSWKVTQKLDLSVCTESCVSQHKGNQPFI